MYHCWFRTLWFLSTATDKCAGSPEGMFPTKNSETHCGILWMVMLHDCVLLWVLNCNYMHSSRSCHDLVIPCGFVTGKVIGKFLASRFEACTRPPCASAMPSRWHPRALTCMRSWRTLHRLGEAMDGQMLMDFDFVSIKSWSLVLNHGKKGVRSNVFF